MEEKKTKKMTRVEAYVYLNDTKVYVNGKGDKVLDVLSKVGFEPTFPRSDVNAFPFMCISDKQVTYYGHMKQYLGLPQKEISVDDILSIEIVEEKKDDERKGEILDEMAELGEKISDLIEEYGGDIIIEIDQYEVLLRNSGDILYRK